MPQILNVSGIREPAASHNSKNAAEIKSSDAVHVLSFSIIMLNTDLHSPNLKVCYYLCHHRFPPFILLQKRMTLEDYQRNLRGVNEKTDFSPEFLVRISLVHVHCY